ncbi:MAG: WD40 repeat domain-containing protein [Bacteroidales bacterium]|nr:WD40 repeat domain-containing protein [Bacteroidales bacterium]
MRVNRFLALTAVFATLFAGCGTLFAQNSMNLKLLKTLEGHSICVESISWSPDGKYLVSGGGNCDWDNWGVDLIIWDVNNGERLRTLKGHSYPILSVSWSPDGKYLASGTDGFFNNGFIGELFIWDANTGERLQSLEGHSNGVNSVSWSPDGKYLASSSGDGTIIIWDVKSGEKHKIMQGNSVSWSPNSKILSASSGRMVILWDVKSGARLRCMEGHFDNVNSISWSPDGKYLASGSNDGSIIIWNPSSGDEVKTLKGHGEWVKSVSWSPDGRYLASGSIGHYDDKLLGELFIWDVNYGAKLKTLKEHSAYVNSVSWSSDGRYLASGSNDKTVKIWSVKTEQEQMRKMVKKEIEKTGEGTFIKEYDLQGRIIKLTEFSCSDCIGLEFNFEEGKIISAETKSELCPRNEIDTKKNIVNLYCDGFGTIIEFNEFGIKKIESAKFESSDCLSCEYNENGLLIKDVYISEDYIKGTSTKTTITYTYDVMSQDWTTRTGTDDQGKKTVTTRTVEYW